MPIQSALCMASIRSPPGRPASGVSTEARPELHSIAQKAVASGIQGVQVDGNDLYAVYDATRTPP